MMKKHCFLLVALVLFSASLFAAPVVVTWEWMLEDPNVTTFRYQMDGENPDQWVVVDSSVTSYTVKGLDGSQAYTLYLQQSYDGENFSGSAQAVSEPIFPSEPEAFVTEAEPIAEAVVLPAEPALVEEEVVVAEEVEPVAEEVILPVEPAVVEEEVIVANEIEPIAELVVEPIAEEVAIEAVPVAEAEPVAAEITPAVIAETPIVKEKVKADSRFKTTITLGGDISLGDEAFSTLPIKTKNLKAELGIQLKNLKTFNKTFGLGLDVGLAYTPYLVSSSSWLATAKKVFTDFSGAMGDLTHTGTLSVAPMLNIQLGKVALDVGAGGFLTYGPDFKSMDNKPFMYGAFAKLGLAYQINSWFSMGLEGRYNLVLNDFSAIKKIPEAGIYLGFSF